MSKSAWLAIAATVAGAGISPAAAAPRPTNARETIRYETGPCLGSCPSYVLTVLSDGSASFEGRRFTAVHGLRAFKVTRHQFATLRDRLAPVRPRRERRLDSPETCNGALATDQITVDVRWQGGGPASHLHAYFGCDMSRNRRLFADLASAPEALPQLKAFVGSVEDQGAAH